MLLGSSSLDGDRVIQLFDPCLFFYQALFLQGISA
jgi:hypothetical protein